MATRTARVTALALALFPVAGAAPGCYDAQPGAVGGGGQVAIDVAPLSLVGVGDACYSLTVENGAGAVVSSVVVSSDRYGDGAGSASYVAPCDGDTGVAQNRVILEVLGLYAESGVDCAAPPTSLDFQNPGQLTQSVACLPNADSAVSFEIALMRPAQQGFFDIAVNFADVFCSAKIDCAHSDGSPIELLFDSSGSRAATAVFALACTGAPDTATSDGDTTLHLDDLTIDCGGTPATVVVDLSAGLGNLYPSAAAAGSSILYQAQVTAGVESIVDGGTGLSANKIYWTTSLGIDLTALATAASGCTVTTRFTASSGIHDATWTPPGVYPVIDVAVPLTVAGDGDLACGGDDRHGLDELLEGGLGYLETSYPAAPATFDRCAHDDGAGAVAFCDPVDPYASAVTLLLHMDGAAGSSPFVDEGGHTVTAKGGAAIGADARFGSGGGDLAMGQWLEIAPSADLDLGTEDFTIEGWVKPASNTTGGVLAMRPLCSTFAGIVILQVAGPSGAPRLRVYMTGSATSWDIQASDIPADVPIDTWTHLALVRAGTEIRAYVGGVETILSTTYTNAVTGGGNPITLGAAAVVSTGTCVPYAGYDGAFDEWRITKGVARYPVLTATPPQSALPSTTLLLHMDGAAGSSTFVDELGHTVTAVNGAVIGDTAVAGSGGAALDVANRKFLRVTHAADLNFGGDDFTVEGWLRPNDNNDSGLFGKRSSCTGVYSPLTLQQRVNAAGSGPQFRALLSKATGTWDVLETAPTELVVGAWNHVAFVRHGPVLAMVVNGERTLIRTNFTGSLLSNTDDVTIGTPAVECSAVPGLWGYDGALDEWRISKTPLYTNIDVPTAAFPNP